MGMAQPPSEWHSYECNGGTLDAPCGEINVTQDHTEPKAFFYCDKCFGKTWQRKVGVKLVDPLPVDMYFSIRFPHVQYDQSVWVGMTAEAVAHLQKTLKSHVILTWDELVAVQQGVAEAATPAERQVRLLEALNYFAQVQGVAQLSKYA